VFPTSIAYQAEVQQDGQLYTFGIPQLQIPICRHCGEKVFTLAVDEQINRALRTHLQLLTPEEIQTALERVGISPKELADRLGIEESTFTCWLGDGKIQSKAMDNLLRAFFAFPTVRAALNGTTQDPHLGHADR